MSFSHRFFLYGPFALFLALAAGVMVFWWVEASALAARLDAMNGHAVAPGVTLRFSAKRIGGFPFRLDASFENFTLEAQGARGPIVWRAEKFAFHRLTYAGDVTVMEAGGRQEIGWTSASGARRSFVFTPGALRASAVGDRDGVTRFDLDAIGVAAAKLAAGRAQFHIRRDPSFDALDLVVDIDRLRFAGDSADGFPDGLSRLRLEGRLGPSGPFADLLAGKLAWTAALDRWLGAQGVFKIDEAAVFWARCQATSAGALTLDTAHRPAGSLAFALEDCDALDRQAAGVAPRPRAHRPVLRVLADLAAREPADRSGALPVTVVFKDGVVFVGPGKTVAGGFFEPVGLLRALY